MKQADSDDGLTLNQRALKFRNGLAIAMLATRPSMRRKNLAAIRIGTHLIQEGSIYRLQFSSDEMKGRRARGGPLPQMLTEPINRYIDFYRPVLLGSKTDDSDTLFISANCNPIHAPSFSREIGDATEAAFGRRVTTHPFRHAAASSIAKEDPEHVGIVPIMLGHEDYHTSEGSYILADEHAAFMRYHEALDWLENGGEPPETEPV